MPCVLVVEDEDEMRGFLVEVLTNAGFDIVDAKNGDAAARLLHQEDIRLVVTDINLPGYLDGIGVANEARHLHPGIPVIFISGKPSKLLDAWVLEDPAAFLQKPFSFGMLVTAVNGFIRTTGLASGRSGTRLSTRAAEIQGGLRFAH